MEIIIHCQECGEVLEQTSTKAKLNNIDDVQSLIITVKPCKCVRA